LADESSELRVVVPLSVVLKPGAFIELAARVAEEMRDGYIGFGGCIAECVICDVSCRHP
jgi:hypothetical protein